MAVSGHADEGVIRNQRRHEVTQNVPSEEAAAGRINELDRISNK